MGLPSRSEILVMKKFLHDSSKLLNVLLGLLNVSLGLCHLSTVSCNLIAIRRDRPGIRFNKLP
jgi:hypothetical protein